MKQKLKVLAADWMPDMLMVGGAGAVSYAAWLIAPPLGWGIGGVFAIVAGVLLSRGAK